MSLSNRRRFSRFFRLTRKINAIYYCLVVPQQMESLSRQPHFGGAAREEPLSSGYIRVTVWSKLLNPPCPPSCLPCRRKRSLRLPTVRLRSSAALQRSWNESSSLPPRSGSSDRHRACCPSLRLPRPSTLLCRPKETTTSTPKYLLSSLTPLPLHDASLHGGSPVNPSLPSFSSDSRH